MSEINLNEWEWLREVSGLDVDAIKHYKELERKNEALMVANPKYDKYNVYLPIKATNKPNTRGE